MNTATFKPSPARPAPINSEGPLAWVKTNLLADWRTAIGTLVIGAVLLWLVPQIISWALLRAVWIPNYDACRVEGARFQKTEKTFRQAHHYRDNSLVIQNSYQ